MSNNVSIFFISLLFIDRLYACGVIVFYLFLPKPHGISGKHGNGSNDYFATNSSSNSIHLAKLSNPYTGPATEKQKAQREKFAAKQAAATTWLNANRPNTKNGEKGTALYQQAQKLKRAYAFSNVNQVLYKYMDDKNVIKLPDATTGSTTTPTTPSGGGSGQGGSNPGIDG